LDAETRGIIETWIDDVLEKQGIPKTVKLILEEDSEVISKEDLTLGYFLGYTMSTSWDLAERRKWLEREKKKSDKRLERKIGKEKFREYLKEELVREKTESKRFRPRKTSLDEEDENEIRRMLLSKIKLFREKIRKEPYR